MFGKQVNEKRAENKAMPEQSRPDIPLVFNTGNPQRMQIDHAMESMRDREKK